ncbi:MAG: lysozyme inhibitor LprI family protein [Methylomonas sp.]|jgi:uncharacterized protein YecT (DUF1311 family)
MNRKLIFTALALWCGYGSANEALSPDYAACMDQSGGKMPEILNCISAEMAVQDARLNNAYKTARAKLTPERGKQLQAVERVWLTYRKANCDFYATPKEDSSALLRSKYCMINSTSERATELENLKFVKP